MADLGRVATGFYGGAVAGQLGQPGNSGCRHGGIFASAGDFDGTTLLNPRVHGRIQMAYAFLPHLAAKDARGPAAMRARAPMLAYGRISAS
ncbi:hypothetical protein [Nonomuraea sp. CA-141351]|uniref:hypothetical protein n=1 Tax=Nonomuraea sp. CA-141351 TaxID=3239996 RepID=UPI003D8ED32C